jgi:hypothetical protein
VGDHTTLKHKKKRVKHFPSSLLFSLCFSANNLAALSPSHSFSLRRETLTWLLSFLCFEAGSSGGAAKVLSAIFRTTGWGRPLGFSTPTLSSPLLLLLLLLLLDTLLLLTLSLLLAVLSLLLLPTSPPPPPPSSSGVVCCSSGQQNMARRSIWSGAM